MHVGVRSFRVTTTSLPWVALLRYKVGYGSKGDSSWYAICKGFTCSSRWDREGKKDGGVVAEEYALYVFMRLAKVKGP